MGKFKVGDKVRRVAKKGFGNHVRGGVYVVALVPAEGALCFDEAVGFTYDSSSYELVEELLDLTKLDKHYKELSIEEKVALFEAELRGEVIESGQLEVWSVTEIDHIEMGYTRHCKYRVQPKPTENELKKTSILEKMEELKQELESLETK